MLKTRQQEKAYHLLFKQTADLMQSQGHTIKELMDSGIDLPFTPHICKEIWRTIQRAMFGIESTRDLERNQIDKIFDVYCKTIGEIYGETVSFPSLEEIYYSSLNY